MRRYNLIKTRGVPIKAWTIGVQVEEAATKQLQNVASLPFIHQHIAAMPDVHWGMGATVGSVIPCKAAIIPAAVGVDIGCGMMAVETTLTSQQLPENLAGLRSEIEAAVPHGRTGRGDHRFDDGAWRSDIPADVLDAWSNRPFGKTTLQKGLEGLVKKHPKLKRANSVHHLGTLGTGNHFIEICLDETDRVWIMLHSGSRGIGNRIGTYFINKAKEEMAKLGIRLPDRGLAYFSENSPGFDDYVKAVSWAQAFAAANRQVMMNRVIMVMQDRFTDFALGKTAVNCHHNYVAREKHFGDHVWVTRKGAVRAEKDELGIIPGSMGVKSYIVRGKGAKDAFNSCSHGAGRLMSRAAAKRRFTLNDHIHATTGVECRKDKGVLDETPMAYKDIDTVMAAQKDLVEVVHTLKQVVCVKG